VVMYMCSKGINVASVSTVYLLDIATVLNVWYFFPFHTFIALEI